MTYEKTKVNKKPSKDAVKKAVTQDLDRLSTGFIMLYLLKKHRVSLLAAGNVILLLNFIIPEWPSLLFSIIGL